jgi:GTPase SAR1 family protein
MNQMKVLFVGESKSGKSTVLGELAGILSTDLTRKPTQGCHVVKCTLAGKTFDVWDVSGDSKYVPFRSMYYANTDVCVIFGDNSQTWKQDVLATCPGAACHVFTTVDTLKEFLTQNG